MRHQCRGCGRLCAMHCAGKSIATTSVVHRRDQYNLPRRLDDGIVAPDWDPSHSR